MKLSFSTNAFVRHSVFDAIERIAGIGYEGVEILADTPHLYAPSITHEDVERLVAALQRTGLQVANINANTAVGYYGREFWEPLFEPSLANPDEALRNWRIAYSKRCIDLANALGSPCVSITSGRAVPGATVDQSLKFLRESLIELLDYAEPRGVRLGIEYEPGLLVESYKELASLISEMNTPYLGANLDLGHSHVVGEDAEAVISGLSSKLFHIHMEDIRGRKHCHLIPGEGDVDFSRWFQVLRRHGYDAYVTVELYTYPHAPVFAAKQALRYLQCFADGSTSGRNHTEGEKA